MDKRRVKFRDLGLIAYGKAWELQENLLGQGVKMKSIARETGQQALTTDYLLLCQHPAVYTLGKSGKLEHVLISKERMEKEGIEFYNTNRGGDITFHGPGQIVGYPVFDLEYHGTDIGKYLRNLEEVIIRTLLHYGITSERSGGETGVWIDSAIPGKARKICAIGVRCSRWITMHGFALNVNTDLSYFNNIIPCGIRHKQVTSLQKELGREIAPEEVMIHLCDSFEKVFGVELEGIPVDN
jgi:lipoyl(octanoyl) transferase